MEVICECHLTFDCEIKWSLLILPDYSIFLTKNKEPPLWHSNSIFSLPYTGVIACHCSFFHASSLSPGTKRTSLRTPSASRPPGRTCCGRWRPPRETAEHGTAEFQVPKCPCCSNPIEIFFRTLNFFVFVKNLTRGQGDKNWTKLASFSVRNMNNKAPKVLCKENWALNLPLRGLNSF